MPARLGRTILPSDDRRRTAADPRVAVLGDGFWRRHYGGDPDIVGRTLHLNRAAFTIVGVAPPGFFGPEVGYAFDVAVPIAAYPILQPFHDVLDDRSEWWLEVIARRKPGRPWPMRPTRCGRCSRRSGPPPFPSTGLPKMLAEYQRDPFQLVPAAAGTSALRDQYRQPLFTILAVAFLVLLVACANVANLQLARGSERQHEFRLRLALGASRWRIARQLLTESILIAGLGAALGLAFALWGSRLLVRNLDSSGTVTLGPPLDAGVLLFTGTVAILTALLFGILPAWRAGRTDPRGSLREAARGAAGRARGPAACSSPSKSRCPSFSWWLRVSSCGRWRRSRTASSGFRSDGVLVAYLDASLSGIAPDGFVPFTERILTAVEGLPGVASAGLSLVTPVSGAMWAEQFEIPGTGGRGHERTFVHVVTPGWLSVYRTPLLAGRDILESDRSESPPVALVNRAFAQKVLGGKNPLGQTIRTAGKSLAPMEVAGVVEDAVYRDLREDHAPTVYVPFAQGMKGFRGPYARLSIRPTAGPPSRITSAVAAAIARVDPSVTLRFRTLSAGSTRRSCGSVSSRCCPVSSARWPCCSRRSGSTASRPMPSRAGVRRSASAWPSAPTPRGSCG